MVNRSRTSGPQPAPASLRQDGGPAGLRPRAGTAHLSSFIFPVFIFIFLLLSSTAAPAATPPRTVITNTAAVVFGNGSLSSLVSAISNSVNVTTVPARTPAAIELLQYAPAAPHAEQATVKSTEYSQGGSGPFAALSTPVPAGGTDPIDLGRPVPLVAAAQYHAGEPIFVRLTDRDQNWDPAAAETVVVILTDDKTGDQEVLRLTETGPDTGVFTGSIQSTGATATSGNGGLSIAADSTLKASYTDPQDGTGAETQALVDPFGKIFSTANGQVLDGVAVTLMNAATNQPATVFGDDGVSLFPPTVLSGGTARDAGGAVYSFPPGGYRFPFIAPGQYYLSVAAPDGYEAPSSVASAAIQSLPGAPFAIVDPGSRGETFTVNAGPAIHIDIPLDQVTGRLWLQKTAGKSIAALGDFVPYRLTVENVDATYPVLDVVVHDRLPLGFRYRKGSARIAQIKATDPQISADGRTLSFSVGRLDIGQTAEVAYVAEIAAGARAGRAINSATAADTVTGSLSNTATAAVTVTEDLFRSTSTIVGRIVADGCGDKAAGDGSGIPGVSVFLEDGTYAVSDKNGIFHFEAIKPGTHVVQFDTASLPGQYEAIRCDENTRFAGSAISQFVDLQGGALWRVDFHASLKPRLSGEAGIELRSVLKKRADESAIRNPVPAFSQESGQSGISASDVPEGMEEIEYSLPVHVGDVSLRNLRLTVMLPDGALYQRGSSRLNAVPAPAPEAADSVVIFRLGDVAAGWEGTVRFNAFVPRAGSPGDMPTRAVLMFDSPSTKNMRTPVADNLLSRTSTERTRYVPDIVLHPRFPNLSADLTPKDKKQLNEVVEDLKKVNVEHLVVTGHTDANPIHGNGARKFADNYVLSRARAATLADHIARALKLRPDQMTIVGVGPDEPVASNADEKGRAQNRRVELMLLNAKATVSHELNNVKSESGKQTVSITGLRPGEAWVNDPKSGEADGRQMLEYTALWLETQQPGLAWLWPAEGNHPPIPSVKIAVKHDPRRSLKLFLNGVDVDPLYFDGTVKRADGTLAVSVWRGIHVEEGDNRFEVAELDESGAGAERFTRVIHYSGPPVKAEFVPEKSRLAADGKNPPVIAVRLTDKDGHPAREGVIGEFSIDPPYQARQKAEDLQMSPTVASASSRLRYQVAGDGIALIELQPTTATGEALVRFNLMSGEQHVRAWLTPEDRDWILVGLAEGTVGYSNATGNMESLGASGEDLHYYEDGRLAFYAKGRLKGSWLLTMAFDSAKAPLDSRPGLYQTVDPNKYYLLYGDAAEQRHDAASAKKLYIKLERDQFYALFGDYATGIAVTELSRYNRNLTGFKSEMKGDVFSYTVFASDTNQAYVKDEIRGDGTSGLYRLSRKNIVLNSEAITIVTRDRFRSEVVISQQRLARHLDYTIDYEAGTIFFKAPVFSTDENFNPVFIVAEYESFDVSDTAWTYGGRGAVKLLDGRAETGATFVHEGATGSEGELTGVDTTVAVTPETKVRAEAAETKTDKAGIATEGSAWLAEVQHHSDRVEGRAYVRRQGPGFGLGQQAGSETGTMKTGGDVTYRITKPLSAGLESFRQENLSTGAVRDMAELRTGYAVDKYSILAGARHAEDTLGTGEARRSEQVFSGLTYQFTKRLSARIQHDQSVGTNDNIDFPTRTTVGADYKLNDSAALFAAQEWTRGADLDTETTRVGMRASPWTGGQLGSTVEQQTTENGERLFSTTGLKQTWQLTKHWSLDAGLDRSETIRGTGAYDFNTNVPPASGASEDFTAVSFGAGYRQEKWSWSGRVENREARTEDKFSLFTGANGEVREGLALAGGLQTFRAVSATGTTRSTGDLRLALAYRPLETRVIILDRLEYLLAEETGTGFPFDNRRIINNFVTNVKAGARTQFSLQYGAKYVLETIDQTDFRGYTDLTGLEGRYDITKRWDAGLRGSVLHSWGVGQTHYGSGASVGFNAGKNIWLSVGYNFTGFRDRDFSKADFTSEGPFIKLRMKFDQVSVRESVKWFSGQ